MININIEGQLPSSLALNSNVELRATKIILASMSLLWIVGLTSTQAFDLLAFTPGYILSKYYLWTLITAGLFDSNLVMGIVNIIVFVLIGPTIERAWGPNRMIKFLVLVNVSVLSLIFLFMVACFAVTGIEAYVFRGFCGFSGLNAALSVVLKQRWPDRPLISLPQSYSASTSSSASNQQSSPSSSTSSSSSSISSSLSSFSFLLFPLSFLSSRLRLKHVPAVILMVTSCFWFVFGTRAMSVVGPLIVGGIISAWTYLRFVNVDQDTGAVGDLSAEFAFHTLLPSLPFLRPVVEFLSTVVFHFLSRLGFFSGAIRSNQMILQSTISSSQSAVNMPTALPVMSNNSSSHFAHGHDLLAERRRQLAIKAIDEKLAELSRHGSGPGIGTGIGIGAGAGAGGGGGGNNGDSNANQMLQGGTSDMLSLNVDLHDLDAQLADGEAALNEH